MVDNSRNLTWRGRSNLYSGIGVYLAYSGRDDRMEPITDFARWSETPTELRETGTTVKRTLGLGRGRPGAGSPGRDRQPHARLSPELDHHVPVRHRGSPGPVRVGPQERADRQAIETRRVAREPAARGRRRPSRGRKVPEPAESKELKVAAAEPMPVNPAQAADPETTPASDNLPADAAHVRPPTAAEQSTTGASPTGAGAGAGADDGPAICRPDLAAAVSRARRRGATES